MPDIIKDGGPAFPVTPESHPTFWGITVRDYFAIQALAGWLASFGPEDSPKPESCAEFAYAMADAMLVEREKPNA